MNTKKVLSFLLVFGLVFNLVASAKEEVAPEGPFAYEETMVSIEVAETASTPAHSIPAIVTVPLNVTNVPAVVMFHGTGSEKNEAGGGYVLAASMMAEAGIATIRFDLMGNGESSADYVDYNYESGLADAVACANYMKNLEEVNPDAIGVMGWSQGGTLALLATARHDDIFSATLTWAAALDLGVMFEDFDASYEMAKADGYFEMAFDWRTPLNIGFDWFEQVANTDVLNETMGIDTPILAIHGDLDATVPMSDSTSIGEATSQSDYYILEGADHTFNIFNPADEQKTMKANINKTIEFFNDTLGKM